MEDDALTPSEEEYFEILLQINSSPEMQRIVADTKRVIHADEARLHTGDHVVRGLIPFRGFQPNPKD